MPPERLVFTEIFEPFPDAESVVTSVLTDEGGKTRLTVDVRLSVEGGAGHGARRPAWTNGAAISYDRLEDVARGLQRT